MSQAPTDIKFRKQSQQLVFSDGHDSGIFSWTYLRELCDQQDELWKRYLQKLDENKASRDPDEQVVKFFN